MAGKKRSGKSLRKREYLNWIFEKLAGTLRVEEGRDVQEDGTGMKLDDLLVSC